MGSPLLSKPNEFSMESATSFSNPAPRETFAYLSLATVVYGLFQCHQLKPKKSGLNLFLAGIYFPTEEKEYLFRIEDLNVSLNKSECRLG